MILWTIQPLSVYQLIKETGKYRYDPSLIDIPEFIPAYNWISQQMRSRIGQPPDGVTYPVWAIHTWYGKREKPDFRRLRWEWGNSSQKYVCMEIDIPDNQVLLSNYDAWYIVLNDYYFY